MLNNRDIFSSPEELEKIADILKNYTRLPFSSINIPGAVMEGILGHVRNAEVLPTYDFIDVVDRKNTVGWQIKSTLEQTPVTWKRAKIPDRVELITRSERSKSGLKALGDAIIRFCNEHARESMKLYQLKEIGYARLVVRRNGDALYFEKKLCDQKNPDIFDSEEFAWKWSSPKNVLKKEQLIALHGIHIPSQKKWFAWHGRGENQLHFNGERTWWPTDPSDTHAKLFRLPSKLERLSLEDFVKLLAVSTNLLPPA